MKSDRNRRQRPVPTSPPPGRKSLTVPEVAWSLGVSVRTIEYLVSTGELPSVKLGRRRLISSAALDEFLISHTVRRAGQSGDDG